MPQGGTAAHTHQPPQQTHTRTPSPKPTPAPAGSQAEMMELQRAAGNGAVSRMLAQRSTVPVLQRKACSCGGTCPRCREEAEKMQRKAARPGPVKVPPIVHDALHSPGQPLDAATLAFM